MLWVSTSAARGILANLTQENRLIKRLVFLSLLAVFAALVFFLSPRAVAEAPEPPPPTAPTQAERVELIADAILAAEGRCGEGGSGEYGCFQYLPATWRAYSTAVTGKVLVQTEANERAVTEGMIDAWLNEGITERGIFLLWNQGSATGWGPGTKDCYSGVNKWGVPYDSCDYARRGLEYMEEHPL